MSSDLAIQKPVAVIFLDMDGVMIGDRGGWVGDEIRKKIGELFGKKENYSSLEWRTASAHLLSKKAVENLENLIKRVSEFAEPRIVISSSWREDGTVEELREQMFAMHSFSKLIIDKTPQHYWEGLSSKEEQERKANLKASFKELLGSGKYQTRGAEIDYWIRQNYEKLNIKSFVVFDDADDGISIRYPQYFVGVDSTYRLSEAHIEKAYNVLTQTTLSPQDFPSKEQVKAAKKAEQEREQCTIQ